MIMSQQHLFLHLVRLQEDWVVQMASYIHGRLIHLVLLRHFQQVHVRRRSIGKHEIADTV